MKQFQTQDQGLNMKGNEDEYNKGFFAAANVYGLTYIYLLYTYYGKGKE
ncbi:hypothetical protein [Metabacillus sp. RGM 3146]